MLCPFCLSNVVFEDRVEQRRNGYQRHYLVCGTCNQPVPRMYADDYWKYPPVVVSAVGFTQHGKSVYFSSLFYALRYLNLSKCWPYFYTQCLNEESLAHVWDGMKELNAGRLPAATAKVFPTPTLLRVDGVPGHRGCTLVMYDTAGESFNRPSQLAQYARFVTRAKTVLFFVSLTHAAREGDEVSEVMHRLLETYIVGVRELGTRAGSQRLVVVFTMADVIGSLVGDDWSVYRKLLMGDVLGSVSSYAYIARMNQLSHRLHQFTGNQLEAHSFLSLASSFFRSTSFCMVSSLGAAPDDENQMSTQIVPRRVLDPMLSVIGNSRTRWISMWCQRMSTSVRRSKRVSK